MFDVDISAEIQQMADTMTEMVYSTAFSECLVSVTELSQMGMNATWADDIYKCFVVNTNVTDSSVDLSIDIDVNNEFALMSAARDKNLITKTGQDTNVDMKQEGEDWIQNDPLNIEGNIKMILDNIKIRCANVANEICATYKDTIENKIKEQITNHIKEAMAV